MTQTARIMCGLALGAAIALAGPHANAAGEAASPWHEGLNSQVRLVAGAGPDTRFAGVEIRLAEGWKTYWRHPGDAGIPPVFDWTGSENLASAEVSYPLPQRLDDPAGISIGYKKHVLFPVKIEAEDETKPVLINLTFNYAVCAELCIPADAALFLAVPAGEAGLAPSPLIADALARVPQPAGEGLPRLTGATLAGEGKGTHLAVTVSHGASAAAPDLFIEGPENWYLGVPEETGRKVTDGVWTMTYSVPVRGKVAAGDAAGATLRATISSGTRAVEQTVTLP